MPPKKKAPNAPPSFPANLKRINLNAAGIDIGSAEHFVAVPADRDNQPVRRFECFTADLHRLADWLCSCGIQTVAMESTGVYWIPLFQILEARGFEVKLVNAKHAKNVPGRKSDLLDCQWLQQLHTFGLLSASFRPENEICVLRSYLRHRDSLVQCCSAHVQHIHKALTQMNLQLQNVISDITGVTGLRILRAILAGERDPVKLAELKDCRIRSSTDRIAKSLEGDYREEHLFTLQHALELYEFYQQKIEECDAKILEHLSRFEAKVEAEALAAAGLTPRRNKSWASQSKLDWRAQLHRMSGVDLTRIDGIDVLNAQTIISEVGLDMSKWRTEKQFASWLGLCPDNRISGGKVLSTRTRKVVNRASWALRMAAQSLLNSQSALGAYFRRMRTRLGTPKAITATAHKLARLVYRMLKYGESYVDVGMEAYEEKYRSRSIQNLKKRAAIFGYELTPKLATADPVS